jgi:S-adenosylmethionine synthetase
MVRYSEVVLPGHPDKLCDAVAEAVVQAALAVDPDAYAQVEVSVWDYEIWLTGGVVTSKRVPKPFAEIAKDTVVSLGYTAPNAYDATKLEVRSSLCFEIDDPRQYTHRVNDQCIAIGWAGYDEKLDYLPPEHFLARSFAVALFRSFSKGPLKGQGPDGKLLVRLREEGGEWILEHVLATVQQLDTTSFLDFVPLVTMVLEAQYQSIQNRDTRWTRPWKDVEVLINPNGPLITGGPLSDNGQTGRKLVMDYYGPRVPIGGGALYGKDPRHIDRFASATCKEAAIHAVQTGAKECQVTVCYAPNLSQPVDVRYEMVGRGRKLPDQRWNQSTPMDRVTLARSYKEGTR